MSNAGCEMGKTTIEWATDVWNPVTGCTPVSAGCAHCYAAGIAKRFWGERKFSDVQCHEDRVNDPLSWKKPRRVFVNSMSDLFHSDVPDEFISLVWGAMAVSRQHTFMILTKRPDRMKEWVMRWFNNAPPLSNVWLGASVEDQQAADERIPLLLKTPAAVRFVSCEPLLEMVHLRHVQHDDMIEIDSLTGDYGVIRPLKGRSDKKLSWVICGAETGANARPMDIRWAQYLRSQCQETGVPFFFKKNSNGNRMLDGKEWNEMPDQLSGKTGEVKS